LDCFGKERPRICGIRDYPIRNYSGATNNQREFWDSVFQNLTVIPSDTLAVDIAVEVNAVLKRKRKQIDFADLFIAASAIANKLPIATLNRKHFERIDDLELI
jgi:tRNA(fMet)-specific endonuclease VapC